ncbi:retroviral-like aspartic protease family protein [Aetokthonos hydrillicola Thurmond2011]|jgi:predicted aspartyl protease|uniref:Retroviral-like aspartic protease family protein n=1 Tax=Aetokthonos hydrillicola Thurmond2011 TaxID=2712845 RepID=A0AAP5M7L2_9CYAN|nr:retropepsin-like aspartic protease [Aetokthonos hydrillicola]MBO3464170.1 hypothetical protein [Aetokthonos hydrillicola CCALA 1050]MBW4585936.1 retroviral-like aspartic protease family protein [Aetokthonos hydrillicola CCALA 1050]MDR9893837.1 retroviral-like aspartic protease family protein [Aetokthonos hydrillicola Thurmond2011]
MGTALFILLMALVVHYPRRSGPAPIKRSKSLNPTIDVTFNDTHVYEMTLDTGATTTVITEQMAKALKVEKTGILPAQIADGSIVVWPTGTVDSIEVGGVKCKDVKVAISPNTKLLGQSFFGKLDMIIKNDVLEFRP